MGQIEPQWPAAYVAHRVKGQPIGSSLFKGAQTLPDNVSPETLETEIYVPEFALEAEAKARDTAEAQRDQARQEVLEEVRETVERLRWRECPKCYGSGVYDERHCPSCKAAGRIEELLEAADLLATLDPSKEVEGDGE